ncbi:MAG: ribonuclease E inhibitor RraB [Piscinibacter sp.]
MPEFLSEVRLPWFWIVFAVLAAWGVRSALKRDHKTDFVAMQELVAAGIDLEVPREVQFALFVPTEASAQHITDRLQKDGFGIHTEAADLELPSSKGSRSQRSTGYLLRAKRTVVIYGDTLRTVRKNFSELATKENGVYLGWELLDRSPLGQAQR